MKGFKVFFFLLLNLLAIVAMAAQQQVLDPNMDKQPAGTVQGGKANTTNVTDETNQTPLTVWANFSSDLYDHLQNGTLPGFLGEIGGNQDCLACVKSVADVIVNKVAQETERFCNSSLGTAKTCGSVGAVCPYRKDHPEFILGIILEKSKPLLLSYVNCVGQQKCKSVTDAQGTELFQAIEKAHCKFLLDLESKKFTPKVKPRVSTRQCQEDVTVQALEHIVDIGRNFCKDTKDDLAKRKCDFAAKHPKVFHGAIYAHLRPEAWAHGYCTALHRKRD